jgi:hypothetical protein
MPHAEITLLEQDFPVVYSSDRPEAEGVFGGRVRRRFGAASATSSDDGVSGAFSTLDVVSECGVSPLLIVGDGERAGEWVKAMQPLRRHGYRMYVLQVRRELHLGLCC